MENNQAGIRENIFIAEVNLALSELLTDKVCVPDGFGKPTTVPVYFRDRDSKIISDTTPSSMITIAFNDYDRADAVFWNQCGFVDVLETDAEGNPLKYKVTKAPEPVLMNYTITARSQHWDDMIAIETKLAQIFPVNHTLINVKGFNTHMYRAGYNSSDSASLGIFIRDFTIEIIGYLFAESCQDTIFHAIKTTTLEVVPTSDPDADPIETIESDC